MATVEIEDIKPNSHKYREEHPEEPANRPEKRVSRALSGSTKKRSTVSRLADMFLTRDSADIKASIIYDILIPTVKDVIFDAVGAILYDGNGPRSRNVGHRDYGGAYKRRSDDSRTRTRVRDVGDMEEDIIFSTRGDADYALAQLDELMDRYHQVRVADLYDLVQKTCKETCYNYGWYDIREAKVKRLGRNEYIIDLPRSVPLR